MATSIDTSPKVLITFSFGVILTYILAISSPFCLAQLEHDGMEDMEAENVVIEPKMPDLEVKSATHDQENKANDFYSYSVEDSNGKLLPLKRYRNKVTLVVNVASECGFTDDHYKSLIRMRNILAIDNKFEILAFPCNQFGAQEPGSNEDIQRFVSEVYHVNFPVFGKIDVLGDNVPDFFHYLIDGAGAAPNWNFWKYLVNDKGKVVKAWGPRISVEDIFHEVKEVVDNIGYDQPSYKRRHPRTEGEL